MRIVVDRMPDTPRDCLFSEHKIVKGQTFWVCNLKAYAPEADKYEDGYKPRCICPGVGKCPYLTLEVF